MGIWGVFLMCFCCLLREDGGFGDLHVKKGPSWPFHPAVLR